MPNPFVMEKEFKTGFFIVKKIDLKIFLVHVNDGYVALEHVCGI